MWPFSPLEPKTRKVNFRSLDKDYAVSDQLLPSQIPAVAAAGFRSIVCARPDNEDYSQPSFAEVAREAERAGLLSIHLPVDGTLSEATFKSFEQAMQERPKPILAYCRSGGRAASLYTMLKRA